MAANSQIGPSTGDGVVGETQRAASVLRRSLRRGPERGALLALFFFRITEMATWVAILVWAFNERGAVGTGVIALAQLVPATLLAPVASVMGDRMSHRRALILGFLVQAVACVVTAIVIAGNASFVVVCIAAAVLSMAISLSRPVFYSTLPDIAEGPDELMALNSASVGIEGVSDFVGPVIAAILLSWAGADLVLLVMAGFCCAAAVSALAVPLTQSAFEPNEEDAYFELFRSGVACLLNDRAAALLTALIGVEFVVVGMLDILGVVLAFEAIGSGPGGPGLLAAAIGVGAVLGAAATVWLVGARRLAPAIVLGAFVAGVPLLVAATSVNLAEALALFVLSGAGTAFVDVAVRTLTQRVVAPEVLSRVFGIQESLLLGGTAVGTGLATLLVAWLGVSGAFVVAGLLLPLPALVTWPWIRRLDERSVLPGAAFTLLRGIPMFAALPQARLERLARGLAPVEVPAGGVVVREGDRGDRFFVITEGTAVVAVGGTARRALGPGDAFGEIALLHDVPRTATVTASTPLRLEALDRGTFLEVVTGSASSNETARRGAQDLLDDA